MGTLFSLWGFSVAIYQPFFLYVAGCFLLPGQHPCLDLRKSHYPGDLPLGNAQHKTMDRARNGRAKIRWQERGSESKLKR